MEAVSYTHLDVYKRQVYHEGWAQNGAIVDPHKVENIELHLRYQGTEAGPLFWACLLYTSRCV